MSVVVGLSRPATAQSNIDPAERFAWSENVGWINFRPTHVGATVHADHLAGFAWAENVGWIQLGADGGGPYANTGAGDWGVNRDGAGNLSGFTWSENVGWINFGPSHGGVSLDAATGAFDGFAWSPNVDWIHFRSADPSYGVRLATADLSITKSDGVTAAVPGQSVTYTLIVSNGGPSDEPSAALLDVFSPMLACGWSSVAAGGATGNTPTGTGDLGETLALPAGNSVTYTVICAIDLRHRSGGDGYLVEYGDGHPLGGRPESRRQRGDGRRHRAHAGRRSRDRQDGLGRSGARDELRIHPRGHEPGTV